MEELKNIEKALNEFYEEVEEMIKKYREKE